VQLLEEEAKETSIPGQVLRTVRDQPHRLRTEDGTPAFCLKLSFSIREFRSIRQVARGPSRVALRPDPRARTSPRLSVSFSDRWLIASASKCAT
jgi:hypothetical protein